MLDPKQHPEKSWEWFRLQFTALDYPEWMAEQAWPGYKASLEEEARQQMETLREISDSNQGRQLNPDGSVYQPDGSGQRTISSFKS